MADFYPRNQQQLEEEILLLLMLVVEDEKTRPPWRLLPPFFLQLQDDADCLNLFRFSKAQIERLILVWRIPEITRLEQGCVFSASFGVSVLLRRFTYPARLIDLEPLFRRSADQLSRIFKKMVYTVRAVSAVVIRFDLNRLSIAMLNRYANAVHLKGAPLRNCIGFVDGTVRPICRPSLLNLSFARRPSIPASGKALFIFSATLFHRAAT